MKKISKKQIVLMIASIVVLSIVTAVLIAKKNKNEKLKSACTTRNGTWDDKKKECTFPEPTPDNNGSSTDDSFDPSGETGTGIQWSPNVIASEIATKIEGMNLMVYPDLGAQILALTDAQLKVLYAYYNSTHAVDYPTITQLFANEWDNTYWGKSNYDMVVDRFRSLGLS